MWVWMRVWMRVGMCGENVIVRMQKAKTDKYKKIQNINEKTTGAEGKCKRWLHKMTANACMIDTYHSPLVRGCGASPNVWDRRLTDLMPRPQKRRPWVPRAVTLERTNYSQIRLTDLFWLGPRGRLRIPREYAQNWTGAETNCHSACRIFGVLKSSTSEYSISMMYTWDGSRIFVTIHEYNKYSCPKFLCTLYIIKWINS